MKSTCNTARAGNALGGQLLTGAGELERAPVPAGERP
jgi:hypothetical protein